jgi:hypothetical protein
MFSATIHTILGRGSSEGPLASFSGVQEKKKIKTVNKNIITDLLIVFEKLIDLTYYFYFFFENDPV